MGQQCVLKFLFLNFNNFSGLFVTAATESSSNVVDGGQEGLVKKFITVDTKKLKDKRAKRFELKSRTHENMNHCRVLMRVS